jgi:hypothetical protein
VLFIWHFLELKYFFFYWRYNPLWLLAFSMIFFHSALFSHCFLHCLTPIICKSSSMPAIHLFCVLPLNWNTRTWNWFQDQECMYGITGLHICNSIRIFTMQIMLFQHLSCRTYINDVILFSDWRSHITLWCTRCASFCLPS